MTVYRLIKRGDLAAVRWADYRIREPTAGVLNRALLRVGGSRVAKVRVGLDIGSTAVPPPPSSPSARAHGLRAAQVKVAPERSRERRVRQPRR